MCGIFISNNPSVNNGSLSTIESCLRFRGPDASSGLVSHLGWRAYHSRLSIIDINSGVNQPVIDGNGGILVFNGEILNYKELGIKYFKCDYTSDSKLLSDLLATGQMNPNELDGFFAFVYVDKHGQLRNACRDRFGVKPLFYHVDGDYISFSSEPKVFKELFDLSVNDHAIEEYYATRAPIFSGSFFTNVNSVEPGHCLKAGKYFDCIGYLSGSYETVTDKELEESIKKGITTRLVSDAPVGLLLSRGIDSNLMKELGDFNRYYTIGFDGDEDIEYLKSNPINGLNIVECQANEYLESFNYLLDLRGEPMSVPNEVLLYRVATVAADDGIKVLLSGEGADEFFGGYDRVFKWAANTSTFDLDIFLNLYCYKPPKENSELYKKFADLFQSKNLKSVFEMVRWFFIRYHMPVLFRRLDFALMAAGIEGREPIANHHVFEFAAKLSKDELMGKELGKIPLRKMIEKYLGTKFAFEKKVGFPVNLTKIFNNPDNLSSYDLWFQNNLKVLK
ncbi:asparagine synthetase B [Psychromonas sp. SR45-3]|uniref:asparagine synthetase B family protein n=1 Tax=Psychromonas sp. SR45-3 TaxID=2760930 RepID=UPI0015FE584D|nr:asparagine synthase-related protein [Psychromonas sp. SR45-3]MBB1274706.1 asparagine synthase [Psychromonas sp. SR45-3]